MYNYIEKVIKEEEEAFLKTLDKGIKLIDSIMEKGREKRVISGVDAFTLYDTYGFPIDLTELIAKEHGFAVELEEFEKELKKQKERSRNATAKEEGDWIEITPHASTEFLGYDQTAVEECRIARYRTVKIKGKESYHLVFDKTPFYAESGGQVGDSGYIEFKSGEKVAINNTVKENGLHIHIAENMPTEPAEPFTAAVDAQRREQTANNHTATHLLHFALRKLIGKHIEQKGSLVSAQHLRFDFSHYEKLDSKTLRDVERMVNSLIRMNIPLEEKRDVPIEEAREMGAMALFGEKYGDRVRVIRYGESVELCGGTHSRATGNLGFFKILSESAIAAGIRRIEATTGFNAELLV